MQSTVLFEISNPKLEQKLISTFQLLNVISRMLRYLWLNEVILFDLFLHATGKYKSYVLQKYEMFNVI